MKTVDGQRPIVQNKKYAPGTGIQYDFEKVLTAFVESKSVRYEDFVKIWREKKMSLICAGRQSQREAKEFMEECMKMAFKMFLPPYGFQARVGALYLLYGLYFTQPCMPPVKIRVTRADWVHVKGLQEEFLSQNHHDSNFILHKLLAEGAFYFCAVSEEAKGRYTRDEDSHKAMAEELREDRQKIDELFSEETFEQISLIHNQYHQLKIQIAGPDASRPDRSLDVLQDKFPASITELIQQHHDRWKKKEASRQPSRGRHLATIPEDGEVETAGESDADHQPSGSVGQRRAKLKDMAFRGAKTKQRYKHRKFVTENSPTSSPEKSPKKKRGRPSGKKTDDATQRSNTTKDHPTASAEAEESAAVTEPSESLLHMPELEDDTSGQGKRPGRKRKSEATVSTSQPPSKQSKSSENDEEEAEGEMSDSVSLPTVEPKKRGRPSKVVKKVGRPVGRPRKDSQNQPDQDKNSSGAANTKAARLKVVPLKIKDSSKRKKKT